MTGKLIVIEGGDGSGKTTQTALALEALKNIGAVQMFDFPRYGKSVAGDIVGKALKGEYGDFLHLDPHLSSLPYMIDRAGARSEILAALAEGNVICNRYTPSNVIYHSAKYKTGEEQDMVTRDLETLEYVELVIYLHVHSHISQELVLRKEAREYLGTERRAVDQHEADQSYQQAVVQRSLQLVEQRDTWHTIECMEEGDKIMSPEKVHEMVMEQIKAVL
jgi:dTMP kinase